MVRPVSANISAARKSARRKWKPEKLNAIRRDGKQLTDDGVRGSVRTKYYVGRENDTKRFGQRYSLQPSQRKTD